MSEAIVIRAHGGPEVLLPEPVEVGAPGPGELRLRQTAIGVNFHDVYVRQGLYRTLALPGIPGIEGVGVVEEAGPGVTGFAPGDRVACLTLRYGGYATHRLLPAELAVRVPDGLDDRVVAATFLKGLTVQMLVDRVHRLQAGQTVLVHAAAGGVGQLLSQWARRIGATVIGTVGSEDKARVAREAGCEHVILYRQEDFVARVREITRGRGVDVAYDAVGRDTFSGSLDCLAPRGHLVNYGQASGPVEPLDISRLGARSGTVSRPAIVHYVAERGELEAMSAALFGALSAGWLRPGPAREFPLGCAADAHRWLESRAATGSTLLRP
ncbi:quinone oxidoreductase family protein [Caldimonas tepidiphila]|uniref:quinone oxidoreductase family protein n=1 Tax=Caldimonas tepidiphila TaxID=2315841 RepID=UPI000E5B4D00|nr:quinone oxidoreductase [Caldimonas tepidiphila]